MRAIEFIMSHWELVVLVLGFLWHVYKLRKQGKTTLEALTLAMNVLKDESKMVRGEFSKETYEKLEGLSEVLNTSEESMRQVREAMKGNEIDVRIGTYKGKPIYLSEALGIGALVKKIRKRI